MAEEYLTDDEQFEAVKRWLVENGLWVVAGVALGAALLFGYRYYDNSRNERALKASAEFGDMATALDKNDRVNARRIAEHIIDTYSGSPYADQAELTLARIFVDEGQDAKALAPLTQVMTGSKDEELRNIARLRVARVQIDMGKPDDAIGTLAGGGSGPFLSNYHEVRGDALRAKKDLAGAAAEYRAAVATADPRSTDVSTLQLKIADLAAPPASASPTAVPATSQTLPPKSPAAAPSPTAAPASSAGNAGKP